MSFNQFENLFLEYAISELEKQLIELKEWEPTKTGRLYLGKGYTFLLLSNNKLTIAEHHVGKEAPRQDIIPVNCYNFYRSMCLWEAIQEFSDRQNNPEKYITPFFI